MPKPITKKQMADLWFAEFVSPNHHCGLCGNSGVIDTRGKVFTAAGVECGVKAYCICPNGRSLRRAMPQTQPCREHSKATEHPSLADPQATQRP